MTIGGSGGYRHGISPGVGGCNLTVTELKPDVGQPVSIAAVNMERTEMTTAGAQTLFLHTGRGKSGSSTIQSLAQDHAPFMASAGVHCPLTSNGLPNHARLAAALCDQNHDPKTLRGFRDALEKSPHPKVFISGEALLSVTRDGMMRLKRLLDGRDIRVLAYVRDYPSWLQSRVAGRQDRSEVGADDAAAVRSRRSRRSRRDPPPCVACSITGEESKAPGQTPAPRCADGASGAGDR